MFSKKYNDLVGFIQGIIFFDKNKKNKFIQMFIRKIV